MSVHVRESVCAHVRAQPGDTIWALLRHLEVDVLGSDAWSQVRMYQTPHKKQIVFPRS